MNNIYQIMEAAKRQEDALSAPSLEPRLTRAEALNDEVTDEEYEEEVYGQRGIEVGDWVTYLGDEDGDSFHVDLTVGGRYKVIGIEYGEIQIIDDAADEHSVEPDYFEL